MMKKLYGFVQSIGIALQAPLLLLIRLYWGYQFAITGLGKLNHLEDVTAFFQSIGIPFSEYNAIAAGATELVCGLLLCLGLFSRLITIPLIGVMLVAYFTAHLDKIAPIFTALDPGPFLAASPFLFLFAATLIFCFGPGKYSLDALIFKQDAR